MESSRMNVLDQVRSGNIIQLLSAKKFKRENRILARKLAYKALYLQRTEYNGDA